MIIGLPTEIKNKEFRVGLTPDAVAAFVKAGHPVLVQKGAGVDAGYPDEEYIEAGATIKETADEVWNGSEMVVKVKEPLESEYKYFRKDLIIYTYFHLAADRPLTEALLASGTAAVAYETIVGADGRSKPGLIPMSEIAGRMAVQEGAKYLERSYGGRGVLLAGVPGVEKGEVVILGGGSVGTNAALMAMGLGANVTILDINRNRLAELDTMFGKQLTTVYSTHENILKCLAKADLVVGAVLLKPGREAPKLVKREDLSKMKKGALVVDVVIDQGGCFETSHPTTHDDPVFEVDGVMHYCVANIPGAVPRTSTQALANATLPYGLEIANKGMAAAMADDPGLLSALNTYEGKCTFAAVAEALDLEYADPAELLGI